MPPNERSLNGTALESIRSAAVTEFAQFGYHGSSVRDIGRRAGVSVSLLYHYFPSKQDLLMDLVREVVNHLDTATREALAAAGADPVMRLRSLVRTHIKHEATHQLASFVANTELRSMLGEHRAWFVAQRDIHQSRFNDILAAGARKGIFSTEEPRDTARAIATMCTAVSTWYRPGGPMSPDDIADCFAEIALKAAGVDPQAAKSPRKAGGNSARTSGQPPKNRRGRAVIVRDVS